MKIVTAAMRPRRRMNLTPMIDVVFLLLVFFMMVSRFGAEQGVPLGLTGAGGAAWSGPPRLIDIHPDHVTLNGRDLPPGGLVAALVPLMTSPEDVIVLRAAAGSDVQDLLGVMDTLQGAGLSRFVVVE